MFNNMREIKFRVWDRALIPLVYLIELVRGRHGDKTMPLKVRVHYRLSKWKLVFYK